MRTKDLAEVLLGVVGVWFIASAIPSLALLAGAISETPPVQDFRDPRAYLAFSITHIVLTLAVGFALLLSRRPLASRLFPDASSHLQAPGAIQAAAFAVVGVLLVAEGLSSAAEHVFFMATSSWSGFVPSLAGEVTKAGLGLALFFRAADLATYWQERRASARRSYPDPRGTEDR